MLGHLGNPRCPLLYKTVAVLICSKYAGAYLKRVKKQKSDGDRGNTMAQEKQTTKEKIVESAWELFYEKGYDNTTVDDIIALSGTSKGSFYYHFDSKDALLGTLSNILDDRYSKLREKMDSDMNSFEKLMYINYDVHSFMERKIKHELLASLYSSQLITKGDVHLLDQNRTYYKLLTELIEEGQKRGEITKDKTAYEISRFYSICERALVSDWCMGKNAYSLGEKSKEYMPIMMEHFKAK